MRSILLAISLLIAACGGAMADTGVAGDWRANLGHGVSIDMNVTPDGNWSSETRQSHRVVRRMSGTYKQSASSDQSGTLVFTPTDTSTGSSAQIETDEYQLVQGGHELRLTSEGDTMVFAKQRSR